MCEAVNTLLGPNNAAKYQEETKAITKLCYHLICRCKTGQVRQAATNQPINPINRVPHECLCACVCLQRRLTLHVSLRGFQTVGEEDCDLLPMHYPSGSTPGRIRMGLLILFRIGLPYASSSSRPLSILPRAWRRKANESIVAPWTKKMRDAFPWLSARASHLHLRFAEVLRWAESLHLACFYAFGAYFLLSHRIAGVSNHTLPPTTRLHNC